MKKLQISLHKLFSYHLKLRNKILISYFVLILIPLIIFTIFIYFNVSNTLIEKSQYSTDISLSQTNDLISQKLNYISELTQQLAFNRALGEILISDQFKEVSPDLIKNYSKADEIIKASYESNDVYSLELFIDDSIYYGMEESMGASGAFFVHRKSIEDFLLSTQLEDFYGKMLWLPPRKIMDKDLNIERTLITGGRYLKYDYGGGNYSNIGVVSVNILQDDLNKIVQKASIFKNALSYVIDNNGFIYSFSNENLLDSYRLPREELKTILSNKEHWSSLTLNKERVLVGALNIDNTNWTLITVLPYSDILETSINTRRLMIIIMVIIASISYIFAYYIANTMTKDISSLIKRMKQVQSGNLSAIASVHGNDEISELSSNYNYMLSKIKEYSNQQFELGKNIKTAELKALQSQINPHFLYNTLELVHWISLRNHIPEISEIVELLAKFYKLSLNRGLDLLTIKDEITHVATYVRLQNYRFKNTIQLILKVDEELYPYYTLKLLLQPIVENSILHGILSKPQKSGTIMISAYASMDDIIITIEDDGIGMSQDVIDRIMNLEITESSSGSGYAIGNVIERIKLYYGEDYGLSYKSEIGVGTTVTLRIGCIKEGT